MEIIKAIPNKDGSKEPGIEYCEGWHDHYAMGISVVCGYDYDTGRFRVFMKDNFEELQEIFVKNHGPFVGFNNIGFDNQVLRANSIHINDERCYDILKEIWVASGLTSNFQHPSHLGFSLDDVLSSNFKGIQKSGHGSFAPILWQKKQYAKVVDYCLNDIKCTKEVLDQILYRGLLKSPKTGEILNIPRP